jgi:N-acetyl-anhydromuramyl-L-alanine amidase AmpD
MRVVLSFLVSLAALPPEPPDGGVEGGGAGEEEPALTMLTIVPRGVWDPGGVAAGDRYEKRPASVYTRAVVHHSDFLEPAGAWGIKAYHLEVSGFSDIGYHYVIAPDGVVYEGRPLERMGAHAGATSEGSRGDRQADPDWGSVGIVLDGYFGEELPPKDQRDALAALLVHLRAELPKLEDVIGHREVRAGVLAAGHHPTSDVTVCPGDALFAWLEGERGALRALLQITP